MLWPTCLDWPPALPVRTALDFCAASLQVRWFSFQFLMQVRVQSHQFAQHMCLQPLLCCTALTSGVICLLNPLPVLHLQQLADELNDAHIALSNVLAGLPTGAKITKPDEQEQV